MIDAALMADIERCPPQLRRAAPLLLDGLAFREIAVKLGITANSASTLRSRLTNLLGEDSALVRALRAPRRGQKIPGRPLALTREPSKVRLLTTPGPDGHVHVASFNDWGRGTTDLVSGHGHRVLDLELVPALGHRHELTDQRAP